MRWERLAATYDGPIPPAELAAARWGAGAFSRQAAAAAQSATEARLVRLVHAIAALRRQCGAPLRSPSLSSVTRRLEALRARAVAAL